MKKILISVLVLVVLVLAIFTSCGNRQIFDTTYSFDRAIVWLPNGETIEGEVESWIDYEDGDQIQVKINNVTYLVHSSNIVLIAE